MGAESKQKAVFGTRAIRSRALRPFRSVTRSAKNYHFVHCGRRYHYWTYFGYMTSSRDILQHEALKMKGHRPLPAEMTAQDCSVTWIINCHAGKLSGTTTAHITEGAICFDGTEQVMYFLCAFDNVANTRTYRYSDNKNTELELLLAFGDAVQRCVATGMIRDTKNNGRLVGTFRVLRADPVFVCATCQDSKVMNVSCATCNGFGLIPCGCNTSNDTQYCTICRGHGSTVCVACDGSGKRTMPCQMCSTPLNIAQRVRQNSHRLKDILT